MRVLLDANILYSALLRDVFLWLGWRRVVRVLWTEKITDEWVTALKRNRPDIPGSKLNRLLELMHQLPDCLIAEKDWAAIPLEASLPDPEDEHVLRAAISAETSGIVTLNVKDFPSAICGDIRVWHPDDFLAELLSGSLRTQVFDCIASSKSALKNPPLNWNQFFELMRNHALVKTASIVQAMAQA